MPVALLLLSIFENHGNAQNEQKIDANNAKSGSEDEIEILVSKGGELCDTATLLSGNEAVGADVVLHKRWRSRVEVAAAVELDSC